jgi:transposase
MTSRNELDLEQKINLIKEKERGLSHREIKDKFQVSRFVTFLNLSKHDLM